MPPKTRRVKKPTTRKPRVTRSQGTFPRTKRKKQQGAYEPTYSNPGVWGRAGRALGGIVGGHLGGRPGAALGSSIGGLAHYLGRIFGSGDYRVGAPPAMNSLFQGSSGFPYQADLSFGEKAIVIKHREYLGDVITSATAGGFQVQNFAVNPGIMATFPWLAEIAPSFQLYKWRGLVVEFKSRSADALNSVNTALGSVILATDYNAATFSQLFNNKTEMLNYEGAIDCKPSDNMVMGIECDPKRLPLSELYIRTGDVEGNIQNYDMCSFAIATTGFQGTNVNVGELWISYDVILMKPAMLPAGATLPAAAFQLNPGTIVNPVSTTLAQSSWGSIQPADQTTIFNRLGIVLGYNTTTNVQLVGVRDPSVLTDNMILRFKLYYKGAVTANMGRLDIAIVPGTQFQPYGNAGSLAFPDYPLYSVGVPSVATASQNDGTMVSDVVRKITKVSDLGNYSINNVWNVPANTNVTNFKIIHALGTTIVGSATTSVPGVTLDRLAYFEVSLLPTIYSA